MYFGISTQQIKESRISLSNEDIITSLIEGYEALYESDIEEVLEEGANIDMSKKFIEFAKTYRSDVKDAKAAIKKKDSSEAKKKLKKISKDLDDIEKFIRSTESDAGSVLFGIIAQWIIIMVKMLPLLGLGFITGKAAGVLRNQAANIPVGTAKSALAGIAITSLIPVRAGFDIVAWYIGAKEIVQDVVTIVDNFKAKERTEDAINPFRANLLSTIKKMRKQIDKLEGAIE